MKTAPQALRPWAFYARTSIWARAVIAVLSGAVGSLGQSPYNQPLVMVLAFTLAFLMLRGARKAGAAALLGWCFGIGYFAAALFWIVEPFQIDPDRYAWMAPFALFFMSTGLALFWGAAFWVARVLSPRTWPLVLTWTLAEVARAYLFTGFPWASPAQALVGAAAGQGLAWGGPHGMTLWLMSVAWTLALPVVYQHRVLTRTWQVIVFCAAAASLYISPTAPQSPLTEHWVRLVQPNAEQHLKWQPEFAQAFFDAQLQFTAAPPKGGTPPPSLTVWPETAIPWSLERAQPALDQIASSARGAPVALGLLRREGNIVYNALAVLDGAGTAQQIYDKHHLVPFGEYIPFERVLSQFGIQGLAQTSATGFGSGAGPQLIKFEALGRGLPLICYEAVFAHGVNAAPERPDFLLQITNDAWFGQNAGPKQHLAQARMRAIEQGLPLMRAANTGISAMIDPQGRILASLPMNVAGYLDVPLPRPSAPTFYSRIGDVPLIILLFLSLFGKTWDRFGRR